MVLRRLVVLVAGAMLFGCATEPPVQEMSDARQAIMAAEEAGANDTAQEPLAEARRYITEAEQQIRDEAYGPARANAMRAKNRALQALEAAESAER